jgi:hypothetical protein
MMNSLLKATLQSCTIAVASCTLSLIVAEPAYSQTQPAAQTAGADAGAQQPKPHLGDPASGNSPATDHLRTGDGDKSVDTRPDEQKKAADVKNELDNLVKQRSSWLLGIYVGLLVVFIWSLHWWDSYNAYRFSSSARDALLLKLPKDLSPDDFVRVADKVEGLAKLPEGIAGTTRAIFTYALVLIVGIAVFHLLAVSLDPKANDMADKLLTLLGGGLTTTIGFYFGSKATKEGIDAGAAQDQPKSPAGHIDNVQPDHAKCGDVVAINGSGFGTAKGNVEFGSISIQPSDIQGWSDRAISLKVPATAPPGPVDVSVNPTSGSKLVGHGLFTVVQ